MKYEFDGKLINIPDDYIARNRKALGLSVQECIDMYLSDEGYVENEVVEDLTNKAKRNGVNGGKGAGARKPRKAPTRKPDEIKRALIANLSEYVSGLDKIKNLEVTNIERVIAFEIGEDKYEITLSKKRKPKD